MLETPFTKRVGCSVPIQQAGMGGAATPELAVAVANAGGLGMLAPVMVPAEVLAGTLDGLTHGTRGAIGVNFLMPFLDTEAVKVAASRMRLVEFFYAEPDPALVESVHSGGALACWQVSSLAEAVAAVRAGCDLIVVQGTEAGGHVRGEESLLTLLPAVLDHIEVPIIAAGGIGSPRAMAAALAAGASAVRVGTRFVATRESGAHPVYVEALVKAKPSDTVITEAFSGMWPDAPHRVLRSCIAAAEAYEGDVVGELDLGDSVLPIARFSVPTPTVNTRGRIEAMALYAGESVGAVTGVQAAADVVRELAEGAERLLRQW